VTEEFTNISTGFTHTLAQAKLFQTSTHIASESHLPNTA